MLTELAYAYGKPTSRGKIRTTPADFCVVEELGFELTGSGEHLFLQIEKTNLTTEDMAKQIAKLLHLSYRAVSYAGLKDKFAKTTQWFSLHLPGMSDPDLDILNGANHQVLQSKRHDKKLKIGSLKGNHFKLVIQDFESEETELLERVASIKKNGVPNYYGPQRFGNAGSNLERAKGLLFADKKVKNHHLRGMYYSAARSFLFNEILNLRVCKSKWNQPLAGDLMMLSGTNSVFKADLVDDALVLRVREQDISPAAALWGTGEERLTDEALFFQEQALEPWGDWCQALEAHKLRKAYRSMILVPEGLIFKDNAFEFSLPKGAFATTVLRELLNVI